MISPMLCWKLQDVYLRWVVSTSKGWTELTCAPWTQTGRGCWWSWLHSDQKRRTSCPCIRLQGSCSKTEGSHHSDRSDGHKGREMLTHTGQCWCVWSSQCSSSYSLMKCIILASSQQACSRSCRLMVHMSFSLNMMKIFLVIIRKQDRSGLNWKWWRAKQLC